MSHFQETQCDVNFLDAQLVNLTSILLFSYASYALILFILGISHTENVLVKSHIYSINTPSMKIITDNAMVQKKYPLENNTVEHHCFFHSSHSPNSSGQESSKAFH